LFANCVWGLAEIYRYQSKFSESIECYKQALKLYEDLHDNQGYLYSLLGLADIYLKKKNYNQCREYYDLGETIAKTDKCELELLYIEYGKCVLNNELNGEQNTKNILNISVRAYEKNICWLKYHIDILFNYLKKEASFENLPAYNWLEESKYIDKIKKFRHEKIPPYLILPQRF
jgi:tetratricopeptide (TPR) repeat protein